MIWAIFMLIASVTVMGADSSLTKLTDTDKICWAKSAEKDVQGYLLRFTLADGKVDANRLVKDPPGIIADVKVAELLDCKPIGVGVAVGSLNEVSNGIYQFSVSAYDSMGHTSPQGKGSTSGAFRVQIEKGKSALAPVADVHIEKKATK